MLEPPGHPKSPSLHHGMSSNSTAPLLHKSGMLRVHRLLAPSWATLSRQNTQWAALHVTQGCRVQNNSYTPTTLLNTLLRIKIPLRGLP